MLHSATAKPPTREAHPHHARARTRSRAQANSKNTPSIAVTLVATTNIVFTSKTIGEWATGSSIEASSGVFQGCVWNTTLGKRTMNCRSEIFFSRIEDCAAFHGKDDKD